MTSAGLRDPGKNMDFWYSSEKWKDVLGADEAETICVPPCLDVLKNWKRNDLDEASHRAPHILGQKGEAAFMLKFKELNMGGVLVSGLGTCDLITGKTVPKEIIQKGEWDAIFFHKNRGIFVIEVKATERNDETAVNKRMEKAKTQLDRNIRNIKQSSQSLYQKECICITGFICFPFRNDDRDTYEGYRIIDKSTLNDRALFRKFFETQKSEMMTEVSLLQLFAAEFVCCRSQVEFHSQAYNAMQVATWIMEQDIAQKQDPSKTVNMPGNGPSGKIILTAQQLEIVECREKCITIRGAPGSGKTLILMLRALKAAKENKAGSVFVFVNKELRAKYKNYFFEEVDKKFADNANCKVRKPKVQTIDNLRFVKPEDDVFFDETPLEDFYVEQLESRVNCSGSTTVVFTGLHKPEEADDTFDLYEPRLKLIRQFILTKVLRGTGNIFREWEHYYSHGIKMGHSIYGVEVKRDSFDSFEQVQNEIADKIITLTSRNMNNIDLPSLKMEHIAVITCDDNDSTEMRDYLDTKKIDCGQVSEQARKLKDNSIVAVDVYRNTPSYEWPIVFIVLKPGITVEKVLPIAASRCIASLTIIKYKNTSQPSLEHLKQRLKSIQSSLRRIYSKSYRNVIPLSLPFFFDIEEKWVNLSLKLESDSIITEDYDTLLKKAFSKSDMLIIEGDPGVGKSSLLHRLAYEWTQEQSRLRDYDLVLHIEFRKLREFKFKDIEELVIHYMTVTIDNQDYKAFHQFINDTKSCTEHNILVLLDGYDESALEEQCQELSDFFSSTISKPLRFNVLITSRKGYLSKLRNQGRFIFADIVGFTTESQRQEYISKHFNAINDTESLENTSDVTHLLNSSANLKSLSETPLLLTFICLVHKKITDGTEVELYMNIIWWMIDRYQKRDLHQNVPSLLGFEHNENNKFRVIENNYQYFPQLHLLGEMAMDDIFKSTFTEIDLRNFQLKEIVQQVGFLRKEIITNTSYHTKIEYSFLHRTIQEFLMAFTFFFSSKEPTTDFNWYVFVTATKKGYGIIPAKIQTYLNMLYSSKIKVNEPKKTRYTELIKFSKQLHSNIYPRQEYSCTLNVHSLDDAIDLLSKFRQPVPQSSDEAIRLLQNEAEEGDVFAQYILGGTYELGISTIQSHEEAVKWYKKSAEQGNLNAQFNLGLRYDKGQGVQKSDEEAYKWFKKAAELGHARAQYNLGVLYEKGKGVSQSDKKAVEWYEKAAEQRNTVAQFNLGNMYFNGIGVPQSDEETVKWHTKSAEYGNANAQHNLGWMYDNGRGVPQSHEEAVKWYTRAAKQGNAHAQFRLGFMYRDGKGVLQSAEEAVKWYTKSAEQGNANAQYSLGLMYEDGIGVTQSDAEAFKWYIKSAEQGDAVAQFNLGFKYRTGKGVPQSDEEAIKWFTKAAEQENASAQNSLGWTYQNGQGVQQSAEEALKWYRKAAEQGNSYAQDNLGFMYLNGRGIPQSGKEAVKWYREAAEQGHVEAQFNLGFMYFNGICAPQSDEEAVKWYRRAADQGHANAQFNLEFINDYWQGVPRQGGETLKWYIDMAEQGNADAQNNLGWMFYIGLGVLQSYDEALKWFRKAAVQGNAGAQYNLGLMYSDGLGDHQQSYEEAMKWFRKAAGQGYALAKNTLDMIDV